MTSIVMTYYNRRPMLDATLRTIATSSFKDFEVVIVDDASKDEHRIEDLVGQFSFPIRLIRIDPGQKTWTNPCVPYNIGFDNASGDVIIIQNAECLHIGDVLLHASQHVEENNYLSYAAYGISSPCTQHVLAIKESGDSLMRSIRDVIGPLSQIGPPDQDPSTWMAWFNHPRIRPIGYHWCCAIKADNLVRLNGFDERFMYGIGWDDPDLFRRVRRMGLNVSFFDETDPFVVHLYHESNHVDWSAKFSKNQELYASSESESTYRAQRCELILHNHRTV